MLRYIPLILLVAAAGCSGKNEDSPSSKQPADIGAASVREQSDESSSEQILNACTSLAVDRGGFVPVYGAQLRDILQPTTEGSEMKWEKTETGFILRLTKTDQLSGNENRLGVEFSVREKPITGVTYCGPMVVKVERGIFNDREMSSPEIGRLLYTRFSSTPRFREIEASSRDRQVNQSDTERKKPEEMSSVDTSGANPAVGDCKGKWIYTPRNWDQDVGIAVSIDPDGRFQSNASDYGNSSGKWSVNGRVGEDKIILDGFGNIQNCSARGAQLSLIEGPDRTVHRFKGDPFKEWASHGWQAEGGE
jgi:hypothetical protein